MQKRPATFATPPDRLLPLEAQIEHEELANMLAGATIADYARVAARGLLDILI